MKGFLLILCLNKVLIFDVVSKFLVTTGSVNIFQSEILPTSGFINSASLFCLNLI